MIFSIYPFWSLDFSMKTGIFRTMKYVLITGVSTGLGSHAAQYLMKNGFYIIGSVRSEQDAVKTKSSLGSNFTPVVFDVTDEKAIAQAVTEVGKIVGRDGLFGLVNNAGIAVSGPIKHVPNERWDLQFKVNVLGLVSVTRHFLPLLGGEKDSPFEAGRIINISSISGLIANPFMGPYCASKFAVEAINDVMRREFSIYDIKVICIEPGVIRSEIWDKARKEPRNYGKTDYDHLLAKQDDIIDGLKARAIEPVNVSRVIHKALTLRRPRLRYIVAKKSLMLKIIAYLIPGRIMDKVFMRNMKSDNIRAV